MSVQEKKQQEDVLFTLLMFIEQINQINHVLSETGYEVRLTNSGPQRVKVIKTVRELTG